jgi:hypothetical protein
MKPGASFTQIERLFQQRDALASETRGEPRSSIEGADLPRGKAHQRTRSIRSSVYGGVVQEKKGPVRGRAHVGLDIRHP